MKKIILSVAAVLLITASALAADCESVRPDLLSRAQQMAQNSRDRAIRDFSESSAATLESGSSGQPGQPGAANASSSNCLEKYKEVKVGEMIGVPSVSDLASQALDRVSTAACTSIDAVYDQAAGFMNQSVMLPGNIGGAQVGPPRASQPLNAARTSGGFIRDTMDTINRVPAYIRGIFQ